MPGLDPSTGRWTRNGAEIVVAVGRAFSTPRATRVMRRHLGFERSQLIDRPIGTAMLGPVAKALAESLRYEPRVRLRRMTIEAATRQGAVGLRAEIEIIADGTVQKVAL